MIVSKVENGWVGDGLGVGWVETNTRRLEGAGHMSHVTGRDGFGFVQVGVRRWGHSLGGQRMM